MFHWLIFRMKAFKMKCVASIVDTALIKSKRCAIKTFSTRVSHDLLLFAIWLKKRQRLLQRMKSWAVFSRHHQTKIMSLRKTCSKLLI